MKEKYSLKDFQTVDGMNFIERAKHFQLYIDQLDKDYHQPYYTQVGYLEGRRFALPI